MTHFSASCGRGGRQAAEARSDDRRPVPATELGRTMVREQLRVGSKAIRAQWPQLFAEEQDLRRCIDAVRGLSRFGIEDDL